MKAPVRTALVNAALRLRGRRNVVLDSVAAVDERVRRRAEDPVDPRPPRLRGVRVTLVEDTPMPVWTLEPTGRPPSGRVAVSLHGGAYISEIDPIHWRVLAGLVRRTGVLGVVPLYSLAPAVTAATTVAETTTVMTRLIERFGGENVVLKGDSAGGGLALAVAQQLRDQGAPSVAHLVLVSPWLDVTMREPEQRALEPGDLMLSVDGLVACGRLYAGGLDPADPRVSPLYGDLSGLPPVSVFVGDRDVLVTDARRFVEKARRAGVDVEYVESAGMQHVYPFFPLLPESRAARRRIGELLTETG
ncbi:MAG TPA: alpha/beta hydrolase [Marmoricola sp.]|nr:alpha/beta hydrolase [Marmoricola sp.]